MVKPLNITVILNGKKAGLEPVREAINQARKNGRVDVRVTWEGGDVRRLVQEAHADGCRRLVAGGGDGTVNEVVDALLALPVNERPELAVLPLGTANDFATACTIPTGFLEALELAQFGKAFAIDACKANDSHFINVASGGFGAQVTANTPLALKNFLGGGAYTLSGLAQALNFVPYPGRVCVPGGTAQRDVIVAAVCNGTQAGGGQQLAPEAKLDDGLLDVVALQNFPAEAMPQVISELINMPSNGTYVHYLKVPWVEWVSEVDFPVNLDGEPMQAKHIRFEVIPDAIKLVLPIDCPVLQASS